MIRRSISELLVSFLIGVLIKFWGFAEPLTPHSGKPSLMPRGQCDILDSHLGSKNDCRLLR